MDKKLRDTIKEKTGIAFGDKVWETFKEIYPIIREEVINNLTATDDKDIKSIQVQIDNAMNECALCTEEECYCCTNENKAVDIAYSIRKLIAITRENTRREILDKAYKWFQSGITFSWQTSQKIERHWWNFVKSLQEK
jgi:hypothetical protein